MALGSLGSTGAIGRGLALVLSLSGAHVMKNYILIRLRRAHESLIVFRFGFVEALLLNFFCWGWLS